ncbi:MAG: helix-turn-helix domain-containing protein [Chthoniobacterales bacterium]
MDCNLHRRLTVGELAQVAHLAPARLRQLFRAETGKAPMQYLRAMRMHRAKELLESSLDSVKEISAQVGINDVSHFVRMFGQAWSLTPARYRSRHHNQLNRRLRG